MNIDIFNSISQTAAKLYDQWAIKLAASWIIGIELHLGLFSIFAILVMLDLFTRWIAISYKRLDGAGLPDDLYSSIRGIPEAHREGLISSCVMRRQFWSKMATYMILVLAAILVDNGLILLGRSPMATTLIITYLSMTELLSMVENLDEAGVSALHQLTDILRGRRGR